LNFVKLSTRGKFSENFIGRARRGEIQPASSLEFFCENKKEKIAEKIQLTNTYAKRNLENRKVQKKKKIDFSFPFSP
jgi:hypothetical protein